MANDQAKLPELNPVIGVHILKFLKGIDASNFLEVVNDCGQFLSIASTSDQLFLAIIEKWSGFHKVLLAPDVYEQYLDECEVINDKLVPFEKHNLLVIQPIQRLFLYSCFTVEGFEALSQTYRTPLFQCYSRLLSFNTDFSIAEFGLIDYELYTNTLGTPRDLNVHEKKLFKSENPNNTSELKFCSVICFR